MNASTSHPYGVPQARDWNALSDDAFRALIRDDFEAHYPVAQRFAPRRLRWSENHDWYLRMSAKGWIAPAWPVAFGGMGLAPSKLLIFFEEQERCGIARFQDHGVQMVGGEGLKPHLYLAHGLAHRVAFSAARSAVVLATLSRTYRGKAWSAAMAPPAASSAGASRSRAVAVGRVAT